MAAGRSLLALLSRRRLLYLTSLSVGCVSLTPPWESPTQPAGGANARPSGGSGGRVGVRGAGSGGFTWESTDPRGDPALPDGAAVPGDRGFATGDAAAVGPEAATGAGGNAVADVAQRASSGAGGESDSDGHMQSGGAGGATFITSDGAGGAMVSNAAGGAMQANDSDGAVPRAPGAGSDGAPASTGGAGGSSGSVDARNGSGGAGGDASTSIGCSGVVDSDICWRLGNLGASCADTCMSSGGTSPNAAKHVGTSTQGGSLAECRRLLGLLGITNNVITVAIDQGLGCHHKPAMPLPYAWASSPAFSDTASSPDASILCGCLR